MLNIVIWCQNKKRKANILTYVHSLHSYNISDNHNTCDVLLMDINDENNQFQNVYSTLKHRKDIIIIVIANTASLLLDVVGLSVYQYMLYDQLEDKLTPCLHAIQEYLVNISSLCIHVNQEYRYIKIQDIQYIRFKDMFVYIGVKQQELATQYTSLEKVFIQLGEDFIYVNRHAIVHIPYITAIHINDVCLGDITFPLSRRRKSYVLKRCANGRWKE